MGLLRHLTAFRNITFRHDAKSRFSNAVSPLNAPSAMVAILLFLRFNLIRLDNKMNSFWRRVTSSFPDKDSSVSSTGIFCGIVVRFRSLRSRQVALVKNCARSHDHIMHLKYTDGGILWSSGWLIIFIIMCGLKLLIHSQTSTVQPLKFGNR